MKLLFCILVVSVMLVGVTSAASHDPEDYEGEDWEDPETGQLLIKITEKPHHETDRPEKGEV